MIFSVTLAITKSFDMDPPSNTIIEASSELANAFNDNLTLGNKDVIELHPDEQDRNAANEVVESMEVMMENIRFRTKNFKNSLFLEFKDELLNPEETQPKRAPRPLFMGPVRKNRRSRGARKNVNNGGHNEKSNANVAPMNLTPSDSDNVNNVKNDHQMEDATNAQTNPMVKESNSKLREWASLATQSNAGINPGIVALATESSGSNVTGTPKRQRSAQTTPNNNRQKKPRTFANIVADNLKLQIVNTTNGINSSQLELLEMKLMEELDKFLASKPQSVPTFHTSSFRNGVLKLIITNAFSAEWVKQTVISMPPLWDGANIVAIECEQPGSQPGSNPNGTYHPRRVFIRRPTVRFFIPAGVKKPTFETVMSKFQLQNDPLNTSDWIAWKAEDRGDGTFYHVSVNEPDIDFIREKSNRLFYCFNQVKIILPNAAKGDGSKPAIVNDKQDQGSVNK